MGPLRLALATAVAVLALCAPAAAAYAPKLQITLDPPIAGKAPAITSVITQKQGETASKTVRVSFPVGFGPQLGAKVASCQPAAEANRACPPETQLGGAHATASVLGVPSQLDGTVHLAGVQGARFRLVIFLHNALLGDQKIVGQAAARPDGGYDTTFDGLPDVLTTRFELALRGGDRGLLQNPTTCGTYLFKAAFTSHQGEQAADRAPVQITGCRATPRPLLLSGVRLSRDGTVRFTLNAAAGGTITIKRAGRRVLAKGFTAVAGPNQIRTRKLKPGRYVVSITASTADGKVVRLRLARTIRR